MYVYNAVDQTIVDERVEQFRDQVRRRLDGRLSEDEFRPLRLMNGLYMQRHAYMLRVAIPYGLLSSEQVRTLAFIARRYDRGFGHFTTRQNIQYNWPELEDVPDILGALAKVQMHAIQTSGNCIRNISCDHLAGVAEDEVVDPRPYCELMRQWSTLHPEFTYLPRKFKLAFTGATSDRAAIRFHDIGLCAVRNEAGEVGFEVWVGGGLGRTPVVAKKLRDFVPAEALLGYTESILRVYNLEGDRERKYKARIKILVRQLGIDTFRRKVEADFAAHYGPHLALSKARIAEMQTFFQPHDHQAPDPRAEAQLLAATLEDAAFAAWRRQNTVKHRVPGYHGVIISLKAPGVPPGDATAEQLEAIAALADEVAFGEVRVLHTQNLLLADVPSGRLREVFDTLRVLNLAQANIGTLTDAIACPGLDFCSLANAPSLPLVHEINARFDNLDRLYDLGSVSLKISGCINACGHHHVGHIGILGINKRGAAFYQIMLGGSESNDASLGEFIGRALPPEAVPDALDAILTVYVERRATGERFIDTLRRLGVGPFQERVYGQPQAA